MDSHILQVQQAIIVPPVYNPAKTAEEAAQGHDTVQMIFDRKVILTLGHGDSIRYEQGVHAVPRHLSDHWYLKANGARLLTPLFTSSGQTSKSKRKG